MNNAKQFELNRIQKELALRGSSSGEYSEDATESPPTLWEILIEGFRAGRSLPLASADRKHVPVYSGCVAYFPAALSAVAALSHLGNQQHNPGQPLHHNRAKSTDHLDCEFRHSIDRGDVTGNDAAELAEAASKAWRALADLQILAERLGAPLAPGARVQK